MSDMNESQREIKPRHHCLPWFKSFPRDYIEGTRALSLAARGAYSDILHLLYERGSALPDSNLWMTCALHVPAWQWRRVREELFSTGKLVLTEAGEITNPRAQRENYGRTPEGHAKNTRRTRGVLGKRLFKSKIKDPTPIESESESEVDKKESVSTVENPISVGASQSAQAREELAGLNGAADPMLRDIVRWMFGGDEVSARNWLATQVRVYGETVVGDAYAKINTDIASGKVVANPLRAWCGIAQRMRTETKQGASVRMTARERYIADQERAMRIARGEEDCQ